MTFLCSAECKSLFALIMSKGEVSVTAAGER